MQRSKKSEQIKFEFALKLVDTLGGKRGEQSELVHCEIESKLCRSPSRPNTIWMQHKLRHALLKVLIVFTSLVSIQIDTLHDNAANRNQREKDIYGSHSGFGRPTGRHQLKTNRNLSRTKFVIAFNSFVYAQTNLRAYDWNTYQSDSRVHCIHPQCDKFLLNPMLVECMFVLVCWIYGDGDMHGY